MSDSPKFFDEYVEDEGIFADKENRVGAHGDVDALTDLNEQTFHVAPMQFQIAPDGLPAPSPSFDGMAVLNADARVDGESLVCLRGPCRHYVEQQVEVDGVLTTCRFCTRVRTWAEPSVIDDTDIIACSGHELPNRQRDFRNEVAVARANLGVTDDLGLCYHGSCEHYLGDTSEAFLYTFGRSSASARNPVLSAGSDVYWTQTFNQFRLHTRCSRNC
jgi:hypothetical protein